MEVKQMNQLMIAMGRYGIKTVHIKKEGFELSLERETNSSEKNFNTFIEEITDAPIRPDFVRRRDSLPHSEFLRTVDEQKTNALTKEDISGTFIESPMVGTAYLSPSPNDPAYIKVGDTVYEDTIVCLVEAMKVMNEIRAGVSGVVTEVLIENASPVEFGSKLFKVTTK